MSITALIDRVFYPDVRDKWDDLLFRQRVLARLRPTDRLLDLGAGAGIVEQMNFRGLATEVCGVDPDPRVLENPYLDDAKVGTGEAIPYPDDMFDLVIADNVAEHLAQPADVLREIGRVLKPGGYLMFKTPNRTHYMPLIARATPHGFHRYVNRIRGRAVEDTFPTLYKANSRKQITTLAAQTGFIVDSIELIEGRPEYLRINPLTYLVGVAYERLVNASQLFRHFRVVLIASLRNR